MKATQIKSKNLKNSSKILIKNWGLKNERNKNVKCAEPYGAENDKYSFKIILNKTHLSVKRLIKMNIKYLILLLI